MALYQGLAEWNRIDVVVEKAVELGVGPVTLFASERARRVPGDDAWARRRERLDRVATAAARQAGTTGVGRVRGLLAFDAVVAGIPAGEGFLIDPRGELTLPTAVADGGASARVSLVVGPDAGFSEAEVARARNAGLAVCRLGPTILRAETAAVAAMRSRPPPAGRSPLSDDCLFCRLVRGEIPAETLRRDERFVAFQDIAPKAPVHVLVIPVHHVPSIAAVDGLDEATRAAMLTFIADVARDLALEGSGYRVTTNHGPHAHQSVSPPALARHGGRNAVGGHASAAERVDQVIELDHRVAVELAGERDRVLRDLEERLDVELALRGNRLTLTGMEPRVRAGAEVVGQLAEMVLKGHPIAPGTIESVADAVEGAEPIGPILDDVVLAQRPLRRDAADRGAEALRRRVRRARHHVRLGPAGTGKTYLAVAIAMAALMRREVAPHHPDPARGRGRRAPRLPARRPRRRRSTRTCARSSTRSTTCSTPSASRRCSSAARSRWRRSRSCAAAR